MKQRAALFLMSVVGFVVVLASTSRYGAGINPDSVSYVFAAKSLLAGNGLINLDGTPFVLYPPLYVWILACLSFLGFDILSSARYVNAITFAGLVFVLGSYYERVIRSTTLALVGAFVVLVSVPLLEAACRILSDAFFVLLVVSSVILLSNFLKEQKWSTLIVVGLFVALACLQRYLGIAIVLTTGLALLVRLEKRTIAEKVKYLLVFGFVSLTPLALWLIRNYLLTSTLTGPRGSSQYSLLENIRSVLDTVTIWWMPSRLSFGLRLVTSLIGVTILFAAVRSWRPRTSANAEKENSRWISLAFTLIYTLILVTAATSSHFDVISDRFLAPVFPFIVLLVLGETAKAGVRISQQGKNIFVHWLAVSVALVFLGYPVTRAVWKVASWTQQGIRGYAGPQWSESPTIAWLRTHQLEGVIYSNGPDAMYILTERKSVMSPKNAMSTPRGLTARRSDVPDDSYLVWFDNIHRSYLYMPTELSEFFHMEKVLTFADGSVYRMSK